MLPGQLNDVNPAWLFREGMRAEHPALDIKTDAKAISEAIGQTSVH